MFYIYIGAMRCLKTEIIFKASARFTALSQHQAVGHSTTQLSVQHTSHHHVCYQSFTHWESCQVCLVVSWDLISRTIIKLKWIFYFCRNSTKLKSDVTPVVSISDLDSSKLNQYQHQINSTNKEEMIQKFPPKNILQKRYFSTDHNGRLN